MVAIGINHVNIPVDDVEASARFVEEVLGLERIPNVDSDAPGAWFEVGDAQVHLTQREAVTPEIHHLAFTVDDFAGLYETLVARDALDDSFGAPLYELQDGAVQMYFREPSGNLLEADWPDIETLPQKIQERAVTREEQLDVEATETGAEATLFR
jgi:catechol 2,3-dioxygenase-like lactoylglutathione lyase family enzyme